MKDGARAGGGTNFSRASPASVSCAFKGNSTSKARGPKTGSCAWIPHFAVETRAHVKPRVRMLKVESIAGFGDRERGVSWLGNKTCTPTVLQLHADLQRKKRI